MRQSDSGLKLVLCGNRWMVENSAVWKTVWASPREPKRELKRAIFYGAVGLVHCELTIQVSFMLRCGCHFHCKLTIQVSFVLWCGRHVLWCVEELNPAPHIHEQMTTSNYV